MQVAPSLETRGCSYIIQRDDWIYVLNNSRASALGPLSIKFAEPIAWFLEQHFALQEASSQDDCKSELRDNLVSTKRTINTAQGIFPILQQSPNLPGR